MSATPQAEPEAWFDASPERLEWELADFAARGLPAQAEARSDGRMVITTALPFEGSPIDIQVVFPHEYPDVEPTVFGPPALIGRHQTRRAGNFCLLEDPTLDWWPTMSAAELVDEDLRWLLDDSAAGPDAVGRGEADMPEPLSQHISVDPSGVLIVPDPFWPGDGQALNGNMVLCETALGKSHILVEAEGLGVADERLVDRFTNTKPVKHAGRWTQLPRDSVGSSPTHDELLAAGMEACPQLLGKLQGALRRDRKRVSASGFVGLTFFEEGPQRGQTRRGWVLLEVSLDRRGDASPLRALRAQAFTQSERARRVPELAGLAQARILVVGAGSIGAAVVTELVKAGVGHTDVADYDTFDVNNSVRHTLDPRWGGVDKAVAVAIEAGALNPFVEVVPHNINVGGAPPSRAQLDALLHEVDVVVDATGSHVTARILHRQAGAAGKPVVLASLTAGSHGGEVAVFRPGGPCFWCFVLGQRDGSVPSPAEGPRSNTTPVGCSTPAFSGAGFDATALAALAARAAVQASGRSAYPAPNHDYMIVNFRGGDPWRQGSLEVHGECPIGH